MAKYFDMQHGYQVASSAGCPPAVVRAGDPGATRSVDLVPYTCTLAGGGWGVWFVLWHAIL